jgi:hypothetical protein
VIVDNMRRGVCRLWMRDYRWEGGGYRLRLPDASGSVYLANAGVSSRMEGDDLRRCDERREAFSGCAAVVQARGDAETRLRIVEARNCDDGVARGSAPDCLLFLTLLASAPSPPRTDQP